MYLVTCHCSAHLLSFTKPIKDYICTTTKIRGAGLGVFANQDFKRGDVVSRCIGLYLPDNILHDTFLEDYVIPSGFQYGSIIILGAPSFVNNGKKTKTNAIVTNHEWGKYKDKLCGKVQHYVVELIAAKKIKAGAEILINYDCTDGE